MQILVLQILVVCSVITEFSVSCVQSSTTTNSKADKNAVILNDLRARLGRLKSLLSRSTAELKANTHHQGRHLDIELVSQTAWINFYTDRLAKVNQRTIKPVELHLLQEALTRRENRLEEELDILRRVEQNFKSKQLSAESLLELVQDRLVRYLEVYQKVPDTYRYVVWGAVDELKHMVGEIKAEIGSVSSPLSTDQQQRQRRQQGNKQKKRMAGGRVAEYEQMVRRIDETMKSLIRYRLYSVVHDREFYN